MTDLNPVDAMTNPYRALCAELVDKLHEHTSMWEGHEIDLVTRARALLDQPVAHIIRTDRDETGPYVLVAQSKSNVPTAAELRQVFLDQSGYVADEQAMLCDDFYAAARAVLARWGNSTPQLEPEVPTDDELWALGNDDFRANYYPTDAIYYARAVLARWGNPTPQPVSVSERLPGPEDCDAGGMCWWWRSDGIEEFWELTCVPDPISHNSKCAENVSYGPWLPAHALPNPETTND